MSVIFRSQRGDTIIEVMVALAVLGLAFAISYSTANHSLQVSQNAQEHSQALQLLDSQVEQARTIASNSKLYTEGPWFCSYIKPISGGKTEIKLQSYSINNAKDDTSVPAKCRNDINQQAFYRIYDSYEKHDNAQLIPQNIFTFTITWQGLGDLGWQQEQISYKLHDIVDTETSGGLAVHACPAADTGHWPSCVPPAPASLTVAVNKIPPAAGNNTPSCSASATIGVGSGISVGLSNGANAVTDSRSAAKFNIPASGNYTAQINSGIPSGYQDCGPRSTTIASGTSNQLNLAIKPICQSEPVVTSVWGVTGYQYVPYQYWGITSYQYVPIYTYGIVYYQLVQTGSYYGVVFYDSIWDGTKYISVPIYGWIPTYTYEPVYGNIFIGYQYEPVYGWIFSYQYEPVYGWITETVYQNVCP